MRRYRALGMLGPAVGALMMTSLAAAVYTMLYDRHAKRVRAGLEDPHTVVGRGFDEPDHMAESVGLR